MIAQTLTDGKQNRTILFIPQGVADPTLRVFPDDSLKLVTRRGKVTTGNLMA